MLSEINLTQRPVKPHLMLCKPNRTTIGSLSEAYEIEYKITLGNIAELSFSVPFQIDISHKLRPNPNILNIKERYVIRLEFHQGQSEYFLITKIADKLEDNSKVKRIECLGLGIQLADKKIKNYSVVSYNASHLLTDILRETTWRLGSIDASFDTMYRSLDFSGTVLEGVHKIAEIFNSLVVWDTERRRIHLYKLNDYGNNKGMMVEYGNLLKSLTAETDVNGFCTRLKAFGKDEMSIQEINPTGSNFVEDFSYFMYPFEVDDQGGVVQSSCYMSDPLCLALLNYTKIIETKRGQFNTYVAQKGTLNARWKQKENELKELQNQLNAIEENLAIANATAKPNAAFIQQKEAKEAEIKAKNNEISIVKQQLSSVESQITAFRESIKIENYLSTNQLMELNDYIIYGEDYVQDSVTDPKQLFDLTIEEFKKRKTPTIAANIDIVNFLEVLEEQHRWDKLNLGDIITIKSPPTLTNIQAKITEIKYNFESGEIGLVISNVKDLLSDQERFIKSLYKTISTSNTVETSKYGWDKAIDDVNDVNTILNHTWSAIHREIAAGVDESVEISRKGILIKDPKEPHKMLIAQHGVLALSKDGGNNWKTALTPDGIVAERLTGQIIAGVNLTISNSAGNFVVNQNGVVASDLTLSVTRSDNKSRTLIDPSNGIKVQKNNGTSSNPYWVDQISADGTGRLIANELVTDRLIIKSGNDVLIDAASRTIDFSKFTTKYGRISAENIDATYLRVNSANIDGQIVADSVKAGAIDGQIITGATLRTASGGKRVVIDYQGLHSFDSNNVNRIAIKTNDNNGVAAIVFYGNDGKYSGEINSYNSGGLTISSSDILLGTNNSTNTIRIQGTTTFNNQVIFHGSVSGLKISIDDIFGLKERLEAIWRALEAKSNIYHTHKVTTADHNHGNPQNKNSGGGTYTTTEASS